MACLHISDTEYSPQFETTSTILAPALTDCQWELIIDHDPKAIRTCIRPSVVLLNICDTLMGTVQALDKSVERSANILPVCAVFGDGE